MVLFGGADAGRTGGCVVVAVAVAVGDGGAGVGGYSAVCWFSFVLDFFVVDFGGGVFFFWLGCAIELPSALKKSPIEPARAGGATMSVLIARARKILFITLLMDRRREV